jgi:hypothetical protein
MKTSQERWAVVINDDPRVYRTIQSVVNVYRFKVTAIASRAFKVSTFVEGVAIPSSVFQADVLPFILRPRGIIQQQARWTNSRNHGSLG